MLAVAAAAEAADTAAAAADCCKAADVKAMGSVTKGAVPLPSGKLKTNL